MITHNKRFEELAQAPVKQTDVEVERFLGDIYGLIADGTIWTSSDLLMTVTIDSLGTFLGTVTKKATVKLMGIVTVAASNDLFQIRTGLYDNDLSSFNYISQGFFYVDTIEFNYESGYTMITMYDHMWTAGNTDYTDAQSTGFSFPLTVEQLATYMAAAMNAELMEDFSLLPNSSYSILVDPYATISNATIQTVVQEIAQATGTTARMSDTTLTFVQFKSGFK